MSSQRYINAASEYKYICILIYNTFCSATFYNDPPMITHAVAQELGPQEVSFILPDGKKCKIVIESFTRKSSRVKNIIKSSAVGKART